MDKLERSNELYADMCERYEKYVKIEAQLKKETDSFKRPPIIDRLNAARQEWLVALQAFRAHLSVMKERTD